MRDANWDEIFQNRAVEDAGATRDESLKSIVPWEEWLTFAIAGIVFLSVVHSIDSANWADDMPSLYPIALAALIAGYALSRINVHELLIHPLALLLGATLVFLQLMAVIAGGSLYVRTDALLDRMYAWWSAVTQDGISSDTLPFIVLVLVLVWVGAYISSWAIFRWRNPWLALVPGGIALMWNISYLPGQFSYSFVFFLFGAVLLVMRLHVSHKEEEWESHGVKYPEFMSLSVLNATFWVTVLLLIAVWLLPLAKRSETASERWSALKAPYTERLAPLARGFIGVNGKTAINVHNLKDFLPFQGSIHPSGTQSVEVTVDVPPDVAAFLRAQAFDMYTSSGWKAQAGTDMPLPAGDRTDAARALSEGARKDISVDVTVAGNKDDFLYGVGQPLESDRASSAQIGGNSTDVTALKPDDKVKAGDSYNVTGSVSIASVDQLRAAGDGYPSWVSDTYLSLPDSLPARVGQKAAEVTSGVQGNPYDLAVAIEKYLRTFPNDLGVPDTPSGRDTVDYFLFDLQRGYFDYHASAMAVMLRTLGVPARVSAGYVLDPTRKDLNSNTYGLSEKNAFAWPEVYFPGAGWVEFNPTPTQPTVNRPGTPPDAGGGVSNFFGELDPEKIRDLQGLGINPGAPQPGETDIAGQKSGGGASAWPVLGALLGAGAFLALVAGAGRFAWEYGLAGMPQPARLWEKTLRLARLGNAGVKATETPREYALRLRSEDPALGEMSYLAATYERTRFGQKQTSDDETDRLESAWKAVRNRLVRRIMRRRP